MKLVSLSLQSRHYLSIMCWFRSKMWSLPNTTCHYNSVKSITFRAGDYFISIDYYHLLILIHCKLQQHFIYFNSKHGKPHVPLSSYSASLNRRAEFSAYHGSSWWNFLPGHWCLLPHPLSSLASRHSLSSLHHSPCWFHCCCELESLYYAPL